MRLARQVLASFAMCLTCLAGAEVRNLMPLKDCERLFWLAPAYNESGEYVLLEIAPKKRKLLESAFREARPISGIDPWLLDGKPVDAGYLIFDFGDEKVCLHVYPYSNKPKSINLSTIEKFEFGKVVVKDVSIQDGWETAVDYRAILKGIERPTDLGNIALFKVEKEIAERPRPEQ